MEEENKSNIPVQSVQDLLNQARFRQSFVDMPKGSTFRDLSTVIIIPTRGYVEEKKTLSCKKCKHKNEYISVTSHGLHPVFVEAFKRLIKPMNVPIIEMMVSGMEVGAAYSAAIEQILQNPELSKFKYILTIEDDNIIPFIPNTQGPLMMLYEGIDKGFDVVGGLYWTKGNPSMPLIYGDPKDKRSSPAGMFKVRFPADRNKNLKKNPYGRVNNNGADWMEGELVACNGLGMGFTLFKMDIFRDERIKKPWFQTISDHGTDEAPGVRQYTQDLWFFEKLKPLGYKVAVDTRVKVGHLDVKTGIIY